MKQNIIFTVFSLGTCLTGIMGCSTSNTATQAEVKTHKEIKVNGSGSTYPAIKALAKAYETNNSHIKITFLPESQSGSGIAAVKKGIVEIGTVSRRLKPTEDDGSIVYGQLAQDALVVATHPSVKGVTNLQTSQLKAIYSGKVTNWRKLGGPDAKIILLDRPEDESAKKLLRQYYLGKELKNAPAAVIMRQEGELINAVQNTPYSIGAFSLAYAISNKLPVNRLSLNGVEPTPANVEAGKYKMVRNIGIVRSKKPSATTQGFFDFAFSNKGGNVLRQSAFAPSTQK
ncbi:MAG: substrate-binding domain-containing protein [Calothrix sp. MO_167.B42]|nr:substrate-binding domain-containing protein [Calothrix sp. MO_167.B42]